LERRLNHLPNQLILVVTVAQALLINKAIAPHRGAHTVLTHVQNLVAINDLVRSALGSQTDAVLGVLD
jgi:hypothetical protein